MERGPVLSRTYDLVLGRGEGAAEWTNYVQKDHYDVFLANDPGIGQISQAIYAKLREVTERYQDMDEWDMVEETHKLEEWRKAFPPGSTSSHPMRWEDALVAQGKEQLIAEVESDERASDLFDQLLGEAQHECRDDVRVGQ